VLESDSGEYRRDICRSSYEDHAEEVNVCAFDWLFREEVVRLKFYELHGFRSCGNHFGQILNRCFHARELFNELLRHSGVRTTHSVAKIQARAVRKICDSGGLRFAKPNFVTALRLAS